MISIRASQQPEQLGYHAYLSELRGARGSRYSMGRVPAEALRIHVTINDSIPRHFKACAGCLILGERAVMVARPATYQDLVREIKLHFRIVSVVYSLTVASQPANVD